MSEAWSLSVVRKWLKWQLPYVMRSYTYLPVTFVKRVLLKGTGNCLGAEPPARWFWNKWGWLSERLLRAGGQQPIWINMNSGGEVVIGRAVVHRLTQRSPRYALSTESYDGFSLLQRTYGSERVFFPPWDHYLPVRRVLRVLQPRCLIFIQNAYFPVLLHLAQRAGVKTILVNAIFNRDVHVGNPFMQRAIALGFHQRLDAVAVQSEADYHAARQLGIPENRLSITGDIHADLRHLRLSLPERLALRRELGFEDQDPILLIGSTHLQEEPVICEAFSLLRQRYPQLRLIIAVRQIVEAAEFSERLRQEGWRVVRRSALNHHSQPSSLGHDILLLDTFGELSRVYGVADVSYIGASLVPLNARRAGHNPLEPLAHGVVPLFGPYMGLWEHVTQALLQEEPSLQVDSASTLAQRVGDVLEGKVRRSAVRELGERLVGSHAGAVERTLAFLEARIPW